MAQFNAGTFQEEKKFPPIPSGWYEVIVNSADIKENSNHNGYYLALQFVITEGNYQNRRLFEYYNIDNPNEDTVKIAMQGISDFARAAGYNGNLGDPLPNDTEWYINRTCQIKVGFDKKDPDKNRIFGYKTSEKGQVQSLGEVVQNQAQGQPVQPQGRANPFWNR